MNHEPQVRVLGNVPTADMSRLQAALLAKPRPNFLQRLLRQLRKDNR